MKVLVLIVLAFVIVGCTTSRGFDRGVLRSEVTQQRQITEDAIKKALTAQPQLPNPFKLALYFAPQAKPDWYRPQWLWTGEDKDRVLKELEPLRVRGAVSEIIVIPQAAVEGADNKAARLAAARVGANAVLMIGGTADMDRYNNILGPLYILLITGAFIPGTEADALFMASATMWDVANEFLYLGVEAEGLEHQTRPAFFIAEEQMVKAAKGEALDALAADIRRRLSALVAK